MKNQILYREAEYARVKWYLISSGKSGTIEDILCVTREGILKAAQMQVRLHTEGVVDLNEMSELDE